jgi:hypothetical protein
MLLRLRVFASLLLAATAAGADEAIETPEAFLTEAFGAQVPAPQTLWLDDKAQAQIRPILNHIYPQARLRYWRVGNRTAWILDETGKEFPITAGFVLKDQAIDLARVLIYRESRGDEIRYPAFLKQFNGAHLASDGLQPAIDGISGATLSVSAMQRMARTALTLNPLAETAAP